MSKRIFEGRIRQFLLKGGGEDFLKPSPRYFWTMKYLPPPPPPLKKSWACHRHADDDHDDDDHDDDNGGGGSVRIFF